MTEKTHIYVLSDSIGETAELLAKAASIQFDQYLIGEIHKYSFVSEKYQFDEIIDKASTHNSMIVYTLVKSESREYLASQSAKRNVVAIDALGPIIKVLAYLSKSEPKREVGLNRKLNDEYFEKVESVEFAVKYDDGKDPRGILKADIVLLGISRTSKTPLSMYLAYRNYKVANIPLVPEVAPPKELFQISSKKIIGLTNDPEKLNTIRIERLKDMGMKSNSTYANMDRILSELDYAHQLFTKLRCPIINVSAKAIEETASIITSIVSNDNDY
ncbi:regulator of PEP synthase PpsR (kinase-PPPase family) [Sedimentibacter acidaminivorans]|uniref:Putative pyruvate, phosphate dikinase regulatory protein n=1 Tax=Sedimentibacter acidaminivorans TaxID=913099 RepID=A0ABS4GHQ6_9FIRM|nr:pyruvate, water dikinase regulatory protein [Sedimentibacter acidaminivorans]MBP1927231.1 regulator of PEP synthase PpsR (kinase-PPPase family) [Sedimentibacter acidaminivorans]